MLASFSFISFLFLIFISISWLAFFLFCFLFRTQFCFAQHERKVYRSYCFSIFFSPLFFGWCARVCMCVHVCDCEYECVLCTVCCLAAAVAVAVVTIIHLDVCVCSAFAIFGYEYGCDVYMCCHKNERYI